MSNPMEGQTNRHHQKTLICYITSLGKTPIRCQWKFSHRPYWTLAGSRRKVAMCTMYSSLLRSIDLVLTILFLALLLEQGNELKGLTTINERRRKINKIHDPPPKITYDSIFRSDLLISILIKGI